ncbi:MAG: hypothetical protein JNK05_05785 [Myxococcales bacterium]|nr:hypothetical protein [Myxococcales bacterium]
MLVDHGGAIVWMLLGLAGQAVWVEAVLGRANAGLWFWLKALLLVVPIAVAPLSELVAREASSSAMRRWALWVCAFATSLYLAVNACAATLPLLTSGREFALASTLGGTIVAGLTLRWAVRSLATGSIAAPFDDLHEKPRSWAHAIEREASLFGGTALTMTTFAICFVVLGFVALVRQPEQWSKSAIVIVFFALCGLVVARTGLDRRAALRAAQGLPRGA